MYFLGEGRCCGKNVDTAWWALDGRMWGGGGVRAGVREGRCRQGSIPLLGDTGEASHKRWLNHEQEFFP